MIKVRLLKKYDEGDETKREELDTRDFEMPTNYKEFLVDIKKAFRIKKNSDITILAISEMDDEYPIDNQEDLDANKEELKEYIIIIEGENILLNSSQKIVPSSSIQSSSIKNSDGGKQVDMGKEDIIEEPEDEPTNENNQIEIGDEKINFDLNLDIKDSEIEKIIDSQIKEIPKLSDDINDDIQFNIEEYKKGLNDKETKILTDFKNLFDSKINTIANSKSQIIKNKISSSLLEFSKISSNNLLEINKEAKGMTNEFKEIAELTGQMNEHMIDLSEIISKNKIPGIINEEPDNDNDNDNDNDIKDKICFKFNQDKMEFEILAKDAKYITVDNIIIENIGEKNKKYDKLYCVIDKNESDEGITFYGANNKNLFAHHLTPQEEFKYQKPENHSISLKIDSPKPDKTYIAKFYIKESDKEDSPKLSKPFVIEVKIKKEEINNNQDKEIEANKLYNEYNSSYKISELFSKEEALKKFVEFNNNKNLIEELIKEKREEKNKKQEEDLYNEIKNEFNLEENNLSKDEIVNKIKETGYEKEKITDWIKEEIGKKKKQKAENIYETLNKPEGLNKDEVISQIISLNFKEEDINNWLNSIRNNNDSQNNADDQPGRGGNPPPAGDEKKIQELIDMLDNEYNILAIVDEEEVRNKIIELNYNEDEIRDWINIKLSE